MRIAHFRPAILGAACGAVAIALWMKIDNFCVGAYYDSSIGTAENPFGVVSCDRFGSEPIAKLNVALAIGAMAAIGAIVARRSSILPIVQGGLSCAASVFFASEWWYWAPIHYGYPPDTFRLGLWEILVAAAIGSIAAAMGRNKGA